MKKQILLMVCLFVACADLPERPHFLEPAPPGVESPESTQEGGMVSEPTQTTSQTLPPETPSPETPSPETLSPEALPPNEAMPQVADVPTDVAPAGGDVTLPPPTTVEEVTPIVINELYYDAVGSDTNGSLFVELYGKEGRDISGYQLVFVNGDDGKVYNTLTLPPGAKVGKGGFYVIADAKNGLEGETFVPGANWVVNFDPQNGPDTVQLLDAEGELVDLLGYGTTQVKVASNSFPLTEGLAAPDVVNGHSLARKTLGLDTDNNLIDFIDREVPTPGF